MYNDFYRLGNQEEIVWWDILVMLMCRFGPYASNAARGRREVFEIRNNNGLETIGSAIPATYNGGYCSQNVEVSEERLQFAFTL